MPSEPSAEVVFQDGWATIRMQMPRAQYEAMAGALLLSDGLFDTGALLKDGEREKHDRSEIMERFSDSPSLD